MRNYSKNIKYLQGVAGRKISDQRKETDEFEASLKIVEKLLKRKRRQKGTIS